MEDGGGIKGKGKQEEGGCGQESVAAIISMMQWLVSPVWLWIAAW